MKHKNCKRFRLDILEVMNDLSINLDDQLVNTLLNFLMFTFERKNSPAIKIECSKAFVDCKNSRCLSKNGSESSLTTSDEGDSFGLILINPLGLIEFSSPGAKRILDYDDRETEGKFHSIFYQPECVEMGIDSIELRDAFERGFSKSTANLLSATGSEVQTFSWTHPLMNKEKNLIGYLKVISDGAYNNALIRNAEAIQLSLKSEIFKLIQKISDFD